MFGISKGEGFHNRDKNCRGCSSSPNPKSQLVRYPTVKQWEIMINNDVLFPATNEETPYTQLLHYWDCWRRPCTVKLISGGIISITLSLPVQEWFIFGTVSLKDLRLVSEKAI